MAVEDRRWQMAVGSQMLDFRFQNWLPLLLTPTPNDLLPATRYESSHPRYPPPVTRSLHPSPATGTRYQTTQQPVTWHLAPDTSL